jgi:glutathione synthase/RimK-type ligase-like ATP-grasp enzyme
MKLFYNRKTESWYHLQIKSEIMLGREKQIIPHLKEGLNDPCFDLHLKNNQAGPLIGIMTAKKQDGSIAGNGQLFREMQKKLISLHGISFIFTPEGMQEDIINGFVYLPAQKDWIKIKMPFPDLVYNRVPFRGAEQAESFRTALAIFQKKNIPFFNPCFIDKYESYLLFQNHPILQKFLPKTQLIHHQSDIQSFLEKYQSVYLKPALSAKGKGIFRMNQLAQSEICLEGLSIHEIHPNIQSIWNKWKTTLLGKKYMVQEEVHSALYDGKRFDFRILAHAKNNGYQVTGIGIRQSQNQELTTHVTNGGTILSYDLLRSKEHDQFIKTLVQQIGKALSEKFGFFGEFSIDAAISISGKYYIFEVNSKPMSFDEEEIENKRLNQLCLLFFQMTHFSK